jgi:hypothetical protein
MAAYQPDLFAFEAEMARLYEAEDRRAGAG